MKKSHKRLYIFEIAIIFILLINSFIFPILNGYSFALFLLSLLILFKFIFGFERDRHRFTKDLVKNIIIFSLLFFIIYYLLGIIVGYAKTADYFSIYGIFNILIPMIITIILEEILRYEILVKSEGNRGLPILTCLLFIYLNINVSLNTEVFNGSLALFTFFASHLLSNISESVLCTYLSGKSGFVPCIIYRLIFTLYSYFIPLVPNVNLYIQSLIDFLLPLALLFQIYRMFDKEEDRHLLREYSKKSYVLIVPTIVVCFLVYFVSGYFRYYAVAIASGSMNPEIGVGDVVIIDQKTDLDLIEQGDIIAYMYNDLIIVHRVFNIVKIDGETFYFTKGDANTHVDTWTIKKENIIGKVNTKIKYIGLPTVKINELLER